MGKGIQFDPAAYAAQEAAESESSVVFGGYGYKATDAQKATLEVAMEKMDKKKKDFSRRRDFNPDEDVTYINERNAHFNRKMQRAFGEYTHETRESRERHRALRRLSVCMLSSARAFVRVSEFC